MQSGFVFPVTIFFSPVFHYERDYCLNIVITKNDTNTNFILFKEGLLYIFYCLLI